MKVSWKKAFAVGGFLGGLCAVLALAIAGVDALTRDVIERNKIEKERAGLMQVFEDGVIEPVQTIADEDYPTLRKYWTVTFSEQEQARIYSATDTNSYGTVSLLIGVYGTGALGRIVVLENTESYATTLQEKYFDVYNASSDKETAVEEVKVTATYGAKMCRDMIKSAKNHYLNERGQHE